MKCPYAKDHQISTKCSIEYDEEKTIQTSWEQIEIDIISFGDCLEENCGAFQDGKCNYKN